MAQLKAKENGESENFFRKAAGSFFCLLAFLMPLKYGTIAIMPEVGSFYPDGMFDYLIVNWPAASFGVFSGIALLMVLAAFPLKLKKSDLSLCALLFGIAPVVAGVWGKLISPNAFYSEAVTSHILGISAFILTAALLAMHDKIWQKRILYSLGAGTFILTITAFHQYFIGFEDMKEFARMQEKSGIVFSEAIRLKLLDGRVYAAMTSANLLGGFMLTTAPLLVSCAIVASRRFEPQKLSLKIFATAAVVMGFGTLFMTKTRGAFLALAVTGVVWIFSTGKVKKGVKLLLTVLIALAIVAGAIYIQYRGRGFGSVGERAGYMKSSIIMLCEKPLSGHGWGEFFYRHMELKTTSSNESAHNPHNIIADFAIHTGVIAGVIALFAFLYPIIKLWKRREELDAVQYACLWGGIAGFLHALSDVNSQSPAVMSALLLVLLISQSESEKSKAFQPVVSLSVKAVIAIIAIFSISTNYIYLKGDVALSHLEECCSPPVKEKFYLSTPGNVLNAVKRVNELRKDHPFAYCNAANYFFAYKDYDTAENYYNQALKLDPRRPGTLRKLADIAEYRGDTAKAEELRKRAYKLFPSNPEYQFK